MMRVVNDKLFHYTTGVKNERRIVSVEVFPSSKKENVERVNDDRFRIFVREPAQRNLANRRIFEILSQELGVSTGNIRLLTGARSSRKKFEIILSRENRE